MGIALSVTASSFAGARARTSAGEAATTRTTAAAAIEVVVGDSVVAFEEVSPGVLRAETSLGPIVQYANGQVVKEEMIELHGSVLNFLAAQVRVGSPGYTDPQTGSMLFADGSFVNSRVQIGTRDPNLPAARSSEEYKQDMGWIEMPDTGLAFVNGVVLPDMVPSSAKRSTPGLMGPGSQMMWADGVVFKN